MRKPNSIHVGMLCALFLAPLGARGSATTTALDEGSYSYVEAECLTLLRSLRDPNGAGPLEVGRQIDALGVAGIEPMFVALETRGLPNPQDAKEKPQVLSEPQTEAILVALESLGRSNAYPVWHSRYGAAMEKSPESMVAGPTADPAPIPVQAAVQALGGFGLAQDLELIWSVLGIGTEEQPKLSRSLRGSLEQALVSILNRDLGALPELQQAWDKLPDEWLDSVVRSIGKTRDPRGNQLMLDLIQFSPDHARLAASQVQVLGPTNDPRFNSELAASLLKGLGTGEKEDMQAAVLAVGVLEDETVIPALIELLEDPRPGVPANVTHALKNLTTMSLHPSTSVWNMWYRGEQEWVRSEQRQCLSQLHARDPNLVKAALREVGRHRLNRHELARKVALLLMTSNVSVRIEAARVLGELESRWGCQALVGALEDPAESVREAAHGALKRISGRQFGPSSEEWSGLRFP